MNLSTLKKLRCENNQTQADMGAKIGIGRTAYTNKEAGLRKFSVEEAYVVANVFDRSIEEVFFNEYRYLK